MFTIHNVFYPLGELSATVSILILSAKSLTLSQSSPGFYVSAVEVFRKGEIARNEQFLLIPQCFLCVRITFYHFYQVQNCCQQTPSVWKGPKFVVWERVKFGRVYNLSLGKGLNHDSMGCCTEWI